MSDYDSEHVLTVLHRLGYVMWDGSNDTWCLMWSVGMPNKALATVALKQYQKVSYRILLLPFNDNKLYIQVEHRLSSILGSRTLPEYPFCRLNRDLFIETAISPSTMSKIPKSLPSILNSRKPSGYNHCCLFTQTQCASGLDA